MKSHLDKISLAIAKKIKQLTFTSESEWVDLLPIEQLVTGYGQSIRSSEKTIYFKNLDVLYLKENVSLTLSDYHFRLYVGALKSNTTIASIALQGCISGEIQFDLIAENEDRTRLLYSICITEKNNTLVTLPSINLNELFAGESVYVRLKGVSNSVLSNLKWVGTDLIKKRNQKARIVLIRTYGNKPIVQENLIRLCNYLNIKKIKLNNYLFVIYDAHEEHTPLVVGKEINSIYIHGGNYGGGGNASLLITAIAMAHKLQPEFDIDEVVLWDDDAVLEPQLFLRHNGYVCFRHAKLAHTGIVLSKTSPEKIQEFGGLWGAFFDLHSGQLSVTAESQRQMYPYLVRCNRSLNNEWDRRYIGNNQDIEFGTFIYISIPFELLTQCGGSIPFFLRNDDVELGLRIKSNGGSLVCNQNMFAWHESTHNIIGEFYATLHGMIVNSAYFTLEKSWLVQHLMSKATGAASVGNSALLDAYSNALRLFILGPSWINSSEAFDQYLSVSRCLSSRLKNYKQVPLEVVDSLQAKRKVEIYSLTNPNVLRGDMNAHVVFNDHPSGKYLIAQDCESVEVQRLVIDVAMQIGELAVHFDTIKTGWKNWIDGFNGEQFWSKYFSNSLDAIHVGKTLFGNTGSQRAPFYDVGEVSLYGSFTSRMVDVDFETGAAGGLPSDFSPDLYYKLNPDVANSGISAERHYLNYGINENRRYR